jgi:hypothetical protein
VQGIWRKGIVGGAEEEFEVGVAPLAVGAGVGGVVEFDREERAERLPSLQVKVSGGMPARVREGLTRSWVLSWESFSFADAI